MLTRKIFLFMASIALVVVSAAMFAAFEAHVVNVTAHIENALKVNTTPIDFGTVFPQQFIEKPFDVVLSDSFLQEPRVDDVRYVIKQKLKPCPLATDSAGVPLVPPAPIDPSCVADNPSAVPPTVPENPTGFHYLDLCPFLSKNNTDTDGTSPENDTSHPSYFIPATPTTPASCQTPGADATGKLSKAVQDTADSWVLDLKVPPITGSTAQDWPAGCPKIDTSDATYGCDLWIEVTEISLAATEPGATISSVNIGDTSSEANFDMLGWSNAVWPGAGGGWGGGDDGTIRTVSAPIPDDNYKLPYAAELPLTDSATIDMDFGAASATKKLQVRHLDGVADDSFNVYVDGVLVGSYADSTAVETWMTTDFNVSAYNGVHTVRIQLTGAHWANYNTFGQLGISWLKIIQ